MQFYQLIYIKVFVISTFVELSFTQGLPDTRCYLRNGDSAENFFVAEDTPVGAIIGELGIHGDPSSIESGGNINLRLKEADSPVRILPGTSKLALASSLDKEGVKGPSSVYVNVICDRLRTSDPVFVIPVTIRVLDVNDNTPIFINAPYALNISEVTVIGTRVLQGVKAHDADQHGPFSTVHYAVIPGPYSDYLTFENPLEGTLVLRKSLDFEKLPTFTIGLRAYDQGTPSRSSDTVLYVNVVDADDQNPKFFHDKYMAIVSRKADKNTKLTVKPEDIRAYDQDVGINSAVVYSWNSAGADYKYFLIEKDTGVVRLRQDLTPMDLREPVTLVVRATQVDNADRYALTTLHVKRGEKFENLLDTVKFVQKQFDVGVLESLPPNSLVTTLATNRPGDRNLKYYVSDPKFLDIFRIGINGELALRKQVDYENEDAFIFKVFVTDGQTNDSAVVNVTVLNVNEWDPRFRYPQYEFFLTDGTIRNGMTVGKVQFADGDRGDEITLSIGGPYAGMFEVTQQGDIKLRELWTLNTTVVHLVITATDSGVPMRRSSVPVLIHFPASAVKSSPRSSSRRETSEGTLIIGAFIFISTLSCVIIIVLVTYICKSKRPKPIKRTHLGSSGFLTHEKLPPPHSMPGLGAGILAGQLIHVDPSNNLSKNLLFNERRNSVASVEVTHGDGVASARGGIPSSKDTYTATVKSIMARAPTTMNGGTLRTNKLSTSTKILSPKVHPAPTPPVIVPQNKMNIHEGSVVNFSTGGVDWPSGCNSGRVKKLSWDVDAQSKTELDSIENDTATVIERPKNDKNTNLTVYF